MNERNNMAMKRTIPTLLILVIVSTFIYLQIVDRNDGDQHIVNNQGTETKKIEIDHHKETSSKLSTLSKTNIELMNEENILDKTQVSSMTSNEESRDINNAEKVTTIDETQNEFLMKIARLEKKIETLQRAVDPSVLAEIEQIEDEVQFDDPIAKEIADYEKKLFSEERDPSWADLIQPEIEAVMESTDFEGISTLTAECRSTLCRMEFFMNDMQKSDKAESALLTKLSQMPIDMKIRKIEEENGGIRMVLFVSKAGYPL